MSYLPKTKKKQLPKDFMISFIATLRRLVGDISRRLPNDPDVYRIKQRMVLVDSAPQLAIEELGLVLYKYRAPILAGNEDFFLQLPIAPLIKKPEDRTVAETLVPKLKAIWTSLGAKTKSAYFCLVRDLLQDYLEYACQ